MPCYTGRSEHTLLKKDCVKGWDCNPTATFSCGQLCCDEPLINEQHSISLIEQQYCDLLGGRSNIFTSLYNGTLTVDEALNQVNNQNNNLNLEIFNHPCHIILRQIYKNLTQDCIALDRTITIIDKIVVDRIEDINNLTTTCIPNVGSDLEFTTFVNGGLCSTEIQ